MTEPRVFVVHPIPEEALDVMRAVATVTVYPYVDRQISVDELAAAATRNDYLYVMHETLVPAEVIEANPHLLGIGVLGGATGFIDFPAANARKIPIVTADPEDYAVPGGAMQTTADLTMAMILGLAHRLVESDHYCREDRFKQEQTISLLGLGLYGKTVGLLGLGKVGTYMVPRLRAFDMNVIYTKRTRLPEEREKEWGLEWVADKDDVLRRSDYVCIMVDYNPTTHHYIGARELAMMKPTAYLINTGRAWIVEEQALLDALQNGTIAGAGLDVFWQEPPATHDIQIPSALYKLDNVILTPHNGDGTVDNRTSRTKSVAKGIAALIKGETPAMLVHSEINRAVYGHPRTYYDK